MNNIKLIGYGKINPLVKKNLEKELVEHNYKYVLQRLILENNYGVVLNENK